MWDNDGVFELSAGQIVADKYRIDGVLGTGGMGVVVAATHVDLDQRVAIKFLREVSPEALARFQREARLLVRLKSPHVARVIDVGSLDDDTPYIVMEHLDGSDLSSVTASRGKLPVEETVEYVLQASEAVAEAHALGMVHRDLKPANLFLARGPGGTTTVKVLDFGVSKILDDRSTGATDGPRGGDLTNEGVALGSPGYMSPEQMTSARDVDERSDIFSLGALLYKLVGGQTPYKGSSVVTLLASMATEKLTPLRSLAPATPEAFTAVVEKCLAQDKAARYPTVAHLAQALVPFATRRGRVSIEQILATLNITFPDDPLGETMVRPAQAPSSGRSFDRLDHTQAMPPAPLVGPPALGPAMHPVGHHEARQTGPHFTVSAPSSMPASFAPPRRPEARKPVSQVVTIGITLLVLALFAGAATWRALRTPPRTPDDAEEGTATSGTAATASVPTSGGNPFVTGPRPTTNVAPTATAETPVPVPSPAETAITRPKSPGPFRSRPHGSVPHSGPPNPADVPTGRH
jgi:serine/threonine-protein kinase